METLANWEEYTLRSKSDAESPRVPNFAHHLYLDGLLQPGTIGWNDRESKLGKVHESTQKVEEAFRQSFGDLEITAIASPVKSSEEWRIYSATISARDNKLVCAGISLDFMFNPNHVRGPPLDKYPQTIVGICGVLAIKGYEPRVKKFLQGIWSQIHSFRYCTASEPDVDNGFFLEVENEKIISGGKQLLKKLGLNLPQKGAYLPC